MEAIAFGDFQFHAMSHRVGTLDMDRPLPAVAKYALQYLFVQAEFGLMCPISVTDTSIHLIRKFASAELKDYLLPKMLSADAATQWKGTQFMTERAGGSDVGAIETTASCEDGVWRLYGDKWFCSHADADVALLLARPEGAPPGTKGLALFALPRRLKDGRRNTYRIVRLKDKLGTRSMASGEIRLEGAVAYLVGEADQGLKQMMEQVNLSRLSHGVRAAAMMRRCVNEAMVCARSRVAFGKTIIEYPLLRRQLLKTAVPSEQALSMFLFAADAMDRANAGSQEAEDCLRILTPLLKFRACRDNIPVATGAMEVRGGNGYIEEWVNARLVRDAHIGVLWEGTSSINALDIITRAVGKSRAHRTLEAVLKKSLNAKSSSAAVAQNEFEAEVDMARPVAGQYQLGRGSADGIAMNADGAESRRYQPPHFQIAEADDGDRLLPGGTQALQSGRPQPGHEADGMRIIGREHRIDAGQVGERDDTARGIAFQNQSARSLRAKLKASVLESVPAPRGPGIVAADKRQVLTALRNQMPRGRNACLVIVKAGDGIDRRRRKLPRLHDRNARAPQQPRAIFRRGRTDHDNRLGTPRQQRREHMILARGVVTRLRQDHGVTERFQLVR